MALGYLALGIGLVLCLGVGQVRPAPEVVGCYTEAAQSDTLSKDSCFHQCFGNSYVGLQKDGDIMKCSCKDTPPDETTKNDSLCIQCGVDNFCGDVTKGSVYFYLYKVLVDCQLVSGYGFQCSNTCKCKDNARCERINGECPHGCADGFTGTSCNEEITSTPTTTTTTTTVTTLANTDPSNNTFTMVIIPVIGGVAGFLILILLILICVFVHRRSRLKKLTQEIKDVTEGNIKLDGNHFSPFPPQLNVNGTATPAEDGEYDLIPADSPLDYSLCVSALEAHIKKIRESETMPFKAEYEKIPEGQTSPWDYGIRKSIHREKNRFGNIVAYDHSRVALSRIKDDASEYINANFIDGYKHSKAFIATQGPMPQTVDDFWRMCWEHIVPIIVMVANCVENGRTKCEQYWPDLGKTKVVGECTVHTLEEERFSDFIIRCLTIEKGDEKRKLKHFQFTGWPDHGVPRQATPMLTLRRRMRAEMGSKPGIAGPTVVHCSAGVGRSGTFIAVDYLKNQAEEEGVIDVFRCVWAMRYQRVNMVQTWDQYNFIYDALLEAVTVGETTIPCYKFSEIYPKWLVPEPDSNVNKLEQQLRVLDAVKQKLPDNEMDTSMKTINRKKNRKPNILPANYYRPYLQSRAEGSNDYINAVFIQGYYKREAFLVTQAPLPDTRVDFWRMVYDYQCHSIICLHDYTREDASTPPIWPTAGSLTVGPILITFVKQSADRETDIRTTELVLKYGKKDMDTRQITVFSVDDFPSDENVPLSAKVQIALKEAVKRTQQKNEDRVVVTMCKYGVERCGVYCALDYVIDMMEVEQEVDVFQAVRQVQMSRPQLIQNIDQYKFLYEAATTYMEINMAYANFQ